MPRITKAEVRASMLKEPKKTLPKEKKEDKSREEKIKENKSVSVELGGTEVSDRNEKELQPSEIKIKKDTAPVSIGDESQDIAPTKRVSISNFDPTPIMPRKNKILAIEETVVSKLKEKVEELSAEIENLQEEKEKIQAEKDLQDNLLSEIREDSRRAIEEKDKEIQEKNDEIYDLNNQINNLNNKFNTYVEEVETTKNKKVNKIAKFIGEAFATILVSVFGAGIIGLIVLLVAKLLYAFGSWLF